MSTSSAIVNDLLGRNAEFAKNEFAVVPPGLPRIIVIGCIDHRVDPALLLGLKNGEAIVLRNVGGRINPSLLQTMEMFRGVVQAAGMNPTGEIIILHHNECGIIPMSKIPGMMEEYFGVETEELPTKAINDPRTSVTVDIDALRANRVLPGNWTVSGLVYDVNTGLIETIVPPTALYPTE